MGNLGVILVIVGGILAFLDLVLWYSVANYRNASGRHLLLQLAVLFIVVALLVGVSPLVHT